MGLIRDTFSDIARMRPVVWLLPLMDDYDYEGAAALLRAFQATVASHVFEEGA